MPPHRRCRKRDPRFLVYRARAQTRYGVRWYAGSAALRRGEGADAGLERTPKSWRKPDEGCEDWAVKGNPKYRVAGSNVFGGFGNGKLLFLKSYKGFGAQAAINIFKSTVIPALRRNYGNRRYIIMTDGDGSFTAPAFRSFLEDENIVQILWPSNSADVAPQENVWAEGDKLIESFVFEHQRWRDGQKENATNLRDWDKIVHKQFRRIPASYYQSLSSRFEDRVRLLKQRKGQRLRK